MAQVSQALLVRGPKDLLALGLGEPVRKGPGNGRAIGEGGRRELRNERLRGLVR